MIDKKKFIPFLFKTYIVQRATLNLDDFANAADFSDILGVKHVYVDMGGYTTCGAILKFLFNISGDGRIKLLAKKVGQNSYTFIYSRASLAIANKAIEILYYYDMLFDKYYKYDLIQSMDPEWRIKMFTANTKDEFMDYPALIYDTLKSGKFRFIAFASDNHFSDLLQYTKNLGLQCKVWRKE